MSTIIDVAIACGVSPRTVSRVMNGQAYVREETRRKVLITAEKLGYIPDPNARALQSGKKMTIGIVVNSVSSDATLQRVEVISKLFNAVSYAVLVQFAESAVVEEAAVASAAPRCDALIVFTNLQEERSAVFDELDRRSYPFLLVDPPHSVPYPSIHVDRRSGYREAVRFLVHKGRRHPLLVLEAFRSSERLEGFKEGLSAEGLKYDKNMLIRSGKGFSGGVEAAAAVIEKTRNSPVDAVLCHNDKMAFGLLKPLVEAGISIPRDLSLVGFDNDGFSAFTLPALTSIAPGGGDMGAYIFEQIRNRIEYNSPIESRTFGTGLVIRDSA